MTVSKVFWTLIQEKWDTQTIHNCGVASPKFWEGSIILTSGEQQYLFWDTAFQSKNRQDMLEILGGPYSPGCACDTQLIFQDTTHLSCPG